MPSMIALVTPHTLSHRTAEETLALGYLASILRENGHKVTVIDGWLRGVNPSEIADSISQIGVPDIICMSCYRSNLNQSKELLDTITERFGSIPAVCGGYGPTFHDTDFLEAGFSVTVRGEAEHVIIPLIEAFTSKGNLSNIPGITFKKDGAIVRTDRVEPIQKLDSIPFPARDEVRYSIQRKNPTHVCTSRGCEAHCLFCSIFAFASGVSKKNRWRHRSIQNIVDELRYLYESFGITHIKFVDDSFLEFPRDEYWAAEFSEAVLKYNLPLRFRTQVRADRLNENIIMSLKQAGWFATSIGIENAAPSALKRMGKAASSEDNWQALKLLRHHGIYVQMGMILFDDSTTMDELEENYRFLASHNWVVTKGIFTEMFAAEGTPYAKKLSRKGLLQTNQARQNHRYKVQDIQARRVYRMLKTWHTSHSSLYDWVIDSITAPKVLPDEGYTSIHRLCRQVTACDTTVLRLTLDHVKSKSSEKDDEAITCAIAEHSHFYASIWSQIQEIYNQYELVYDGVPNPFLN
jgi:anaerobic magnesium-protoporphyrin IX monomethyl ester cyclase